MSWKGQLGACINTLTRKWSGLFFYKLYKSRAQPYWPIFHQSSSESRSYYAGQQVYESSDWDTACFQLRTASGAAGLPSSQLLPWFPEEHIKLNLFLILWTAKVCALTCVPCHAFSVRHTMRRRGISATKEQWETNNCKYQHLSQARERSLASWGFPNSHVSYSLWDQSSNVRHHEGTASF